MLGNRVTDPNKVSREHLDEVLAHGVNPTIQFSKPGYSLRLLRNVNKPGFLATLNLSRMCRLALSDNKKKNFDLSPLEQCEESQEFYLNSHTNNDFGDLSRFPRLRRLLIEDQLQLRNISFAGSNLEGVFIHNCKNREALTELRDLRRLRAFGTSRTRLDFDSLLATNWPDSMETVALHSGSRKWDERARKNLGRKGPRRIF